MKLNEQVELINKEMSGSIAIFENEIALFLETVKGAKLYFEIGCLWGGTTLLAILLGGVQRVITVDKATGGFWDTGDTRLPGKPVPTLYKVMRNFARFEVAHKVSLIVGKSDPWPLPFGMIPDVMMIDGDHSYEGCLKDWENAKKYGGDVVMIHDYQSGRHPGVQRVVDEHITPDPEWRKYDQAGTLAVFRRVYEE